MKVEAFKGKIAVITGAGSGIGKALAIGLSLSGCRVVLCDRDLKNLEITTKEIRSDLTVLSSGVDVTRNDQVIEFADSVKERCPSIDILINCAGVTIAAKPFNEITGEEWKWIMDINLWGTINCVRAFLPLMAESGATMINLSSMLGLAGMTNQTAYSTTKFAIRGLTESLRMELRDNGINVIAVHPGAVRTNFIKNSWADQENKALVQSYIDKMGSVSATEAAEKIIHAIIKRKGRVLIGKDARRLDLLVRLLPSKYTGVILSQIRKKLQ